MQLPLLHRGGRPKPSDARSGRVVVVIHCVLNQNARDPGAALHHGFSERILGLLLQHDAGLFQMPCPETACLGLQRSRPRGAGIRQMLESPWGRRCCRSLAGAVADQLEEHARSGHDVLAVVGGDRESPGCAVHVAGEDSAHRGRLAEASGVFMKALEVELDLRGLRLPFLPMRESIADAYEEDLAALGGLLSGRRRKGRVPGGFEMESIA